MDLRGVGLVDFLHEQVVLVWTELFFAEADDASNLLLLNLGRVLSGSGLLGTVFFLDAAGLPVAPEADARHFCGLFANAKEHGLIAHAQHLRDFTVLIALIAQRHHLLRQSGGFLASRGCLHGGLLWFGNAVLPENPVSRASGHADGIRDFLNGASALAELNGEHVAAVSVGENGGRLAGGILIHGDFSFFLSNWGLQIEKRSVILEETDWEGSNNCGQDERRVRAYELGRDVLPLCGGNSPDCGSDSSGVRQSPDPVLHGDGICIFDCRRSRDEGICGN